MTDSEKDLESIREEIADIQLQIQEFKQISHGLSKIIAMVSSGEIFEYSDGLLIQSGADPKDVAKSRLKRKAGNMKH